jgi:hypothetical protein
MAAGAGGIGQLIMSALQARTAGGGGPGGASPGMPGMPGQGGDDSGAGFAQQVASLKQADPGMLLQEIKAMKQKCAVLMVQNLERLPNVAGTLSKLIPMFDRVTKEISQAQNVNSAVRAPIQMGAAQPPADSSNATPGAM